MGEYDVRNSDYHSLLLSHYAAHQRGSQSSLNLLKMHASWKWKNLSANALSQNFPVCFKWLCLGFNFHALCEKRLGVPSNPALISLEMGFINSMTKGKTGMDARSHMQMMRADRRRWVKDFDCHSNRTVCLDDRRWCIMNRRQLLKSSTWRCHFSVGTGDWSTNSIENCSQQCVAVTVRELCRSRWNSY